MQPARLRPVGPVSIVRNVGLQARGPGNSVSNCTSDVARPRSLFIEHGHRVVPPSETEQRPRPHSLVSDVPESCRDYQTILIPMATDRKSGLHQATAESINLEGGSGARLHSDDPSAPNAPSDLADPNKGNTVPRDFLYYPPPPPVGAVGPHRHRSSTNPVPNWKARILPWYKRPQQVLNLTFKDLYRLLKTRLCRMSAAHDLSCPVLVIHSAHWFST